MTGVGRARADADIIVGWNSAHVFRILLPLVVYVWIFRAILLGWHGADVGAGRGR
jgi:hypothetical protein